jgi:hypothetical protein
MKIDLRGKTEVNSALRSLVGCKDRDYIRYCIWTPVTNPNRERKRVVKRVFTAMNKVKPYMTDEELHRELSQFDESGFDDIPNWLQQELRARNLAWNPNQQQRVKAVDNPRPLLVKSIKVCEKAMKKKPSNTIAKRLKIYKRVFTRMGDMLIKIRRQRRFPTELEQWETVSDAREHRITNNELTLKDYKDKYLGKPLTVT